MNVIINHTGRWDKIPQRQVNIPPINLDVKLSDFI